MATHISRQTAPRQTRRTDTRVLPGGRVRRDPSNGTLQGAYGQIPRVWLERALPHARISMRCRSRLEAPSLRLLKCLQIGPFCLFVVRSGVRLRFVAQIDTQRLRINFLQIEFLLRLDPSRSGPTPRLSSKRHADLLSPA